MQKQGATIFPVLPDLVPHFKITCSQIGSALADRHQKFSRGAPLSRPDFTLGVGGEALPIGFITMTVVVQEMCLCHLTRPQ